LIFTWFTFGTQDGIRLNSSLLNPAAFVGLIGLCLLFALYSWKQLIVASLIVTASFALVKNKRIAFFLIIVVAAVVGIVTRVCCVPDASFRL
jgi:hypothetical protein